MENVTYGKCIMESVIMESEINTEPRKQSILLKVKMYLTVFINSM